MGGGTTAPSPGGEGDPLTPNPLGASILAPSALGVPACILLHPWTFLFSPNPSGSRWNTAAISAVCEKITEFFCYVTYVLFCCQYLYVYFRFSRFLRTNVFAFIVVLLSLRSVYILLEWIDYSEERNRRSRRRIWLTVSLMYANLSVKYIVFDHSSSNDKMIFYFLFFLVSEYDQTSTNWRLLTSGCGRAGSAECITQKCPSKPGIVFRVSNIFSRLFVLSVWKLWTTLFHHVMVVNEKRKKTT